MSSLLFLFSYFLVSRVSSTPEEPEVTFEQLYLYGKTEYTKGNWHDCIAFMLRAIEDYNFYIEGNDWCREYCSKVFRSQQNNKEERGESELSEEIVEMVSMYRNAQRSLCLLRCKEERFTSRRPPLHDSTIFEDFQMRKPYQYLQFCYWKEGNLPSAVRSAYTYFISNPKEKDALENVAFYMEQDGFKREMLIDALKTKFEEAYMKGAEAYTNEDWELCVDGFEFAVQEFFEEEEKCRRSCEDKLDWSTIEGINPDMTIIITSVYVSVLRCKNGCAQKLSKVNGREIDSFLSSCFEYLHLCYYKLSRGWDVCQSVANSILLNPNGTVMRRNKLFYMKTYGKKELFQPSAKIVEFHKRNVLERMFLDFVFERFKYENGELPMERREDRMPFVTDVLIEDDFEYTQLEMGMLDEAECAALGIAAIFENYRVPHLQVIDELKQRIEKRYRTNAVFQSLSCTEHKLPPKCSHESLIISVDSDRCGAFLSSVHSSGCAVLFCVG